MSFDRNSISHDSDHIDSHDEQPGAEAPPEDPQDPAGFWLRLWAYIIDGVTIGFLIGLMVLALESLMPLSHPSYVALLKHLGVQNPPTPYAFLLVKWFISSVIIIVLICLGRITYDPFFESSRLRATPGKLVMGIYVATDSGEPCRFWRAFARNVLKILSHLILYIGFLMAAVTPRKQALHDLLAGTLVLRKPKINPLQVYAGALLACSLLVLSAVFATKTPKATFVSTTPLDKTTIGIIPPLPHLEPAVDTPAVIKLDETSQELLGVFVRMKQTRLAFDESLLDRSKNPEKTLEIALFHKKLSPEDAGKLEVVPSLMHNSLKTIGQQPVLELNLSFPTHLQFCDHAQILKSVFYFSPGAMKNNSGFEPMAVAFPLSSMLATGRFMIFCSRLDAGQEITVSFEGQSTLPGEGQPDLAWNAKFRALIHPFRTLGAAQYHSSGDPVVFWHPSKGELTIGFYAKLLNTEDTYKIISNTNLHAVKEKPPELIIRIPLPPKMQHVTRDDADNGYKITVYAVPGGSVSLPGKETRLEIEIPPGSLPKTLMGGLQSGRRLIGRFEGSKDLVYNDGVFRFSWMLTFNSEVHVAH